MNAVGGIKATHFVFHETLQIGYAGCARVGMWVNVMSDVVKKADTLGIGTVFPHFVNDQVDGTPVSEDTF